MDVGLPCRNKVRSDNRMILHGELCSDIDVAMESAANAMLEYFQDCREVQIDDANYDAMKKLKYRLDGSEFWAFAFEGKYDATKKVLAVEKKKHKNLLRHIEHLCTEFGGILPIAMLKLEAEDANPERIALAYTGAPASTERTDQLAMSLFAIVQPTRKASPASSGNSI
uniref:Uncharacterized protein n=1 Tax=Arundo donax TaxID=35708 RepID=A0A0A9BF86_ARUDO